MKGNSLQNILNIEGYIFGHWVQHLPLVQLDKGFHQNLQ